MGVYGERATACDLRPQSAQPIHRQLSEGWPLPRVQETRQGGLGEGYYCLFLNVYAAL